MVDFRIIKEWLYKSNEDFGFADANLREDSTFYALICFHFHQAAEKYLKAFIIANNLEFEKTHNLIALLKSSGKIEPALSPLLEECEFLNYILYRYPLPSLLANQLYKRKSFKSQRICAKNW